MREFNASEISSSTPIDNRETEDGTVTQDIDSCGLTEQERLANERYEQDTKERKLLAHWVIYVVSIWLFLVITVVVLSSFLINISDTVLCVLLGTTTINILGLAYIVLQGLFPEHKGKDKDKDKEKK